MFELLSALGDALEVGQGEFWTIATDQGDGTLAVVSTGRYDGGVRTLQGRVRKSG